MRLEVLPLPYPPPGLTETRSPDQWRPSGYTFQRVTLRKTGIITDRNERFLVYTTYLGKPEHWETVARSCLGIGSDPWQEGQWMDDFTQRTQWSAPELHESPEEALRHHALVIAKLLTHPEPISDDFDSVKVVHDWLLEHPQ